MNKRNIELDQARFIGGSLSRDSVLMLQLRKVEMVQTVLYVGWSAEAWTERWTAVRELEMPDLPCFKEEEEI